MRKSLYITLLFLLFFSFPFYGDEGEVKIGLDDYISVIKKNWEHEKEGEREDTKETIPVDYTVNSTQYTGVLNENSMEISSLINITVLKEGWVSVPLADVHSGIISATLNNRDIPLTHIGNLYYGVFNKQGSFDVRIQFVIPLEDGNFSLNVPKSPITTMTISTSRKNAKILVNNARSLNTQESSSQVKVTAVLGAVSTISGAVIRKIEEKEDGDPVISAEIYTLASVGEGMIDCRSIIDYFVREASVRKLQLLIPGDIIIHDVSGKGVLDYSISDVDNQKVMNVELNFPVRGEYSLYLGYEKNLKDTSGSYNIPMVTLENVMRQKGFVGIQAITNVEITSGEEKNITGIDVKELPAALWEIAEMPLLMGYKYLGSPSLVINIKRHDDTSLVTSICEKISYTTIITDDGRALTRAVFSIRNTNEQFLKVKLPDNSDIWSALLSGEPKKLSEDENKNLLLPLEKSDTEEARLKTFDIEIVYSTELPKFGFMGKIDSVLCKTLQEVQRIEHNLYVPESFRYIIGGATTLNQGISTYSFEKRKSRWMSEEQTINDLRESEKLESNYQSNTKIVQQFSTDEDGTFQVDQQKSNRYLKKGAIPVEIQIPTTGKMYTFSKTLPKLESQDKIEILYFSPLIWDAFQIIILCLLFMVCFYVLYFIAGKFRDYPDIPKFYYLGSGAAFVMFIVLLFVSEVNIAGISSVMLSALSLIIIYDITAALIKVKKVDLDITLISKYIFPVCLFFYILLTLLAIKTRIYDWFNGSLIVINILFYCAVAFLLFILWIRKLGVRIKEGVSRQESGTVDEKNVSKEDSNKEETETGSDT